MLGQWPHTARWSTYLFQEFGCEVLNHYPSYTSDLAPSDFHLFLHLTKFLSGQRQSFQNDTEAEMSVTVVPIHCGRFLRHRIQTLVPRYDKCLDSGGEYVKHSSSLTVSINVSIKFGFVCVNGPRETCFVYALRLMLLVSIIIIRLFCPRASLPLKNQAPRLQFY